MGIDIKELILVLRSLAEEKNLGEDVVQSIIEQALAAAWRRDSGSRIKDIRANINTHQGTVDIYTYKEVVETVEDEINEISLADAQALRPQIQVGQSLEEHHAFENLGRVAAQTTKQVILQKLRETERETILKEYESKIGTIMQATITKVDAKLIRCDIGQIKGIMPISDQIPGEDYVVGSRIKVLLKEINRNSREPQLILNRGGIDFLRLLFEQEVPEIENGAVEIKAIVREAGARSKVAVWSKIPNVDPVGTLIGGRGVRVQAVNNEIGSQEKIDIVVWDKDPKQNIINALSSTDIISVTIIESPTENSFGQAKVVVSKDQLSVAIGRSGHNVRLAGQLTGYDIDIVDDATASAGTTPHKLERKEALEEKLMQALEENQGTTDDQSSADVDDNHQSSASISES